VPIDAANRRVLAALVERVDLDSQVARVQAALEQMPEYRGFVDGRADLDDRGPAGIRWNLEAFLRWAADGGDPDPAVLERMRELAAARAAEGRPPEEGLAVYRRAMRAGWEALLESADERERAALGGAFDAALEWLDVIAAVFDRAYAEEREALVSQHERRARRLLTRLVAGERPGAEDVRVADALGFALGGPRRPLAAVIAGGSAAEHLQLAGLLREQGALAISEGLRVVGLAGDPVDSRRLGFPSRLVLCEEPAGGGEDPSGGELREALADLRAVVELAAAAGARGRVELDAYLPELLLARAPQLAARLHGRVLGPLDADLARTLALLSDNGFERAAAAAALPVHRNTLTKRIARIERLTGLDLGDPRDRVTAWLATRTR
jgi:hypothetical protein